LIWGAKKVARTPLAICLRETGLTAHAGIVHNGWDEKEKGTPANTERN
jgi:hypothetical protein